jgi:hypothetical protein
VASSAADDLLVQLERLLGAQADRPPDGELRHFALIPSGMGDSAGGFYLFGGEPWG